MAKSSAAGLLTSVDSMFTTQEERDNAQRSYVTDLSTAEINDFPNHPFKVRMDESMTEMVESVKERGVLSPVLVRPMPDGSYQMVSGHRRKTPHQGDSLPFCGPGASHALPLSHSPPQNLLYLLKRKTLPILFQPVKTFEPVERHGLFLRPKSTIWR